MSITHSILLAWLVLPLSVTQTASRAPTQDADVRVLFSGTLSEKGKYEIDGAFRIESRPQTDLSAFRSVLIHCEKYTKLWGAAPLIGG